jgi:hypothetical protein
MRLKYRPARPKLLSKPDLLSLTFIDICVSRRNSPNTIVYNQCVNIVLKYAVKRHNGHAMEAPLSIHDGKRLPPPPAPGMIDILLAGFPWQVDHLSIYFIRSLICRVLSQSHSELNMFRKAEDPKSSLILTTLSWIDFLRPQICVFENVRGFLKFSLGATQAGIHKIEGGVAMGGLKLLLRALVSMKYGSPSTKKTPIDFLQKLPGPIRASPSSALWHTTNPRSLFPHCVEIRFTTA